MATSQLPTLKRQEPQQGSANLQHRSPTLAHCPAEPRRGRTDILALDFCCANRR